MLAHTHQEGHSNPLQLTSRARSSRHTHNKVHKRTRLQIRIQHPVHTFLPHQKLLRGSRHSMRRLKAA